MLKSVNKFCITNWDALCVYGFSWWILVIIQFKSSQQLNRKICKMSGISPESVSFMKNVKSVPHARCLNSQLLQP